MKHLLYILILCFVFAGCGSPKTVTTDSRIKEQKNIENDIKVSTDSAMYEAINRAIQTAIAERLNISVKQTKYDTDKPVDSETGKPPIKEENDIKLTKETDTQINENTNETKSSASSFESIDKSKDKTKTDTAEKAKTETGLNWWQKMFVVIGVSSLIGFVIWIISKIK